VERAVLRATPPVLAADGVRLPYRAGLCGSAGATAGMASLAACSTLRQRRGDWADQRQWVKGAQAGWKACPIRQVWSTTEI